MDPLFNDHVTTDEMFKLVRTNKSSGNDQVLNEFLKYSTPKIIDMTVRLFNVILDTSIFPEQWSLGIIKPLYKNTGAKDNPNNYRGITILSCLGKLFSIFLIEVRQGENLSPLLFSLYLNDLQQFLQEAHMGLKEISDLATHTFDNNLCALLKLYILLYTDDTVLLAESPKRFTKLDQFDGGILSFVETKNKCVKNQRLLTVFSRGKIRNRPEFYFGENKLDVVDHYKYLGLNFNFNGKFTVAKKELYDKGNRAMFSLLRKNRQLQLPIDIQLQLFDVLVKPVLLYGCEVWAHEGTDILEKLHLRFCKYVLGVNKSTCTNMVYGELGATPLSLISQSRMVMFWTRIKQVEENPKISSVLFQILFKMYKSGNFCSPWVMAVKNVLEGCGFAGAWENQRLPFITNHSKGILKQRIGDQFLQKWSSEINISSKCINYSMFKTSQHLEECLLTLSYHQ